MGGKKTVEDTTLELTIPSLFNRERLKTEEFKPFIYTIPFRKKNPRTGQVETVPAHGIVAAGLIRAVHPYLKSIESELLHYGTPEGRKILSCVIKVTVHVEVTARVNGEYKTHQIKISALADGDVTGVPSADTLVRTVETRALNRALERLLDVSKSDLNPDASLQDEEEYGTPLSLSEKMEAQKKKRDALAAEEDAASEEEDDADKAAEGRDMGESEPETGKDDDW
jgi:hypothetical protein